MGLDFQMINPVQNLIGSPVSEIAQLYGGKVAGYVDLLGIQQGLAGEVPFSVPSAFAIAPRQVAADLDEHMLDRAFREQRFGKVTRIR